MKMKLLVQRMIFSRPADVLPTCRCSRRNKIAIPAARTVGLINQLFMQQQQQRQQQQQQQHQQLSK